MSFAGFHRSSGPVKFPFNAHAAEREPDRAKEPFTARGGYDPIMEASGPGRAMIITGREKTGLIENIHRTKGGAARRIRDPKIVCALEKGLEIKK